MQRMNESSRLPGRRRGGRGGTTTTVSRTLAVPKTSHFQVQIALNRLSIPTARRAGESTVVFLNPPGTRRSFLTSVPHRPGPHSPGTSVGRWAVPSSAPLGPLGAPAPPRAFVPEEPPRAVPWRRRLEHPAGAAPRTRRTGPPPPPRPLLPLVPAPPSPHHFPAATRLRRGANRVGTAGTGAQTQAAASWRAAGGPRLGQARAFPRRARLRRPGRDCQVCAWRRRRRRAGGAALCPASRGRGARARAAVTVRAAGRAARAARRRGGGGSPPDGEGGRRRRGHTGRESRRDRLLPFRPRRGVSPGRRLHRRSADSGLGGNPVVSRDQDASPGWD